MSAAPNTTSRGNRTLFVTSWAIEMPNVAAPQATVPEIHACRRVRTNSGRPTAYDDTAISAM